MKNRNALPPKERRARSRLAKLCHERAFLRASLVHMERVCGKTGCHCARGGEKHASLYISVRHEGKRKLIYVPADWEDRVSEWVEKNREIAALLDEVSQACLERLLRAKQERKAKPKREEEP